MWLYAPLTDIDAAALQTLATMSTEAIETPPAAAPQVSEPTQEPAAAPAQPSATPTIPADCARLHTVNPNEMQLSQITNWFGLDLNTVATLNGIEPNAPLIAGWQICLAAGSGASSQTTAATQTTTSQAPPPPAPVAQAGSPGQVVKYETGDCRTHGGHVYPCPALPNRPEHAVTSLPGVPTKYHAPRTYDRSEHPGLNYEWELIFSDSSHLWDWAVRDFEGCYDALRVHFGEIPEEFGLASLEFRLTDPELGEEWDDLSGMGASALLTAPGQYWNQWPDSENWPNWQVNDLPHPDMARVWMRCYAPREHPEDEVFCRIAPDWGNTGSIHLEGAVAWQLSKSAEQMSKKARTLQYHWKDPRLHHYDSFLMPTADNGSGDPTGFGPCMQLTRVR